MITSKILQSYERKQERLAELANELRHQAQILLIHLRYPAVTTDQELNEAADNLQNLCNNVRDTIISTEGE